MTEKTEQAVTRGDERDVREDNGSDDEISLVDVAVFFIKNWRFIGVLTGICAVGLPAGVFLAGDQGASETQGWIHLARPGEAPPEPANNLVDPVVFEELGAACPVHLKLGKSEPKASADGRAVQVTLRSKAPAEAEQCIRSIASSINERFLQLPLNPQVIASGDPTALDQEQIQAVTGYCNSVSSHFATLAQTVTANFSEMTANLEKEKTQFYDSLKNIKNKKDYIAAYEAFSLAMLKHVADFSQSENQRQSKILSDLQVVLENEKNAFIASRNQKMEEIKTFFQKEKNKVSEIKIVSRSAVETPPLQRGIMLVLAGAFLGFFGGIMLVILRDAFGKAREQLGQGKAGQEQPASSRKSARNGEDHPGADQVSWSSRVKEYFFQMGQKFRKALEASRE